MLQTPRRRDVHLPSTLMRPRLLRALSGAALMACALAACASRASTNAAGALLPSLQATLAGDSVFFLLQVTNTSDRPVQLEPAGQPAYHFTVERTGIVLWDSAAGRAPLDWTSAESLEPGATRSFRASWKVPVGMTGELRVTGIVREMRGPIVQATRFRIQ